MANKKKIIILCFSMFILVVFVVCSKNGTQSASSNIPSSLSIVDDGDFTIEEKSFISDGMLKITNGEDGKKKRYGYLDTTGKLVIPPIYRATVGFSEGLAFVIDDSGKGYYIDKKGQVAIEQVDGKPISFGDLFKDGYAAVSTKTNGKSDGNSYIINLEGEVQFSPDDKGYSYLYIGNELFERRNHTYTEVNETLDKSGSLIQSLDANLIFPSKNYNGFYTKDYEHYGIVDKQGYKKLTEPIYQYINEFVDDFALVVNVNGNVELINSKGNLIIDLSKVYPNIKNDDYQNTFSDGVVALNFKDDKGSIIIDTKGNVIGETNYDLIGTFEEGVAVCKKDGKFGYVGKKGNELLEPIYDYVTNYSSGVGFVRKGEKWYRYSN